MDKARKRSIVSLVTSREAVHLYICFIPSLWLTALRFLLPFSLELAVCRVLRGQSLPNAWDIFQRKNTRI